MLNRVDKNEKRQKRHLRSRQYLIATAEKPRLNVYRSLSNIYAQVINDVTGETIVAASTVEKVSRILAVFLRSRWNFTAISLAIGPVVIMAIVLLAVHKLAILTRAAMLSSAPLLPLTWRVSFRIMKSIPPL